MVLKQFARVEAIAQPSESTTLILGINIALNTLNVVLAAHYQSLSLASDKIVFPVHDLRALVEIRLNLTQGKGRGSRSKQFSSMLDRGSSAFHHNRTLSISRMVQVSWKGDTALKS